MGDEDEDKGSGAVKRAQQPGQTAREVMTGDEIDEHAAAFEIEIRPGTREHTVRVHVPGMDWFVTGADQLRDWLREHRLVTTPQQWSEVERKLTEALMGSGAPVPSAPSGTYQPGDGRAHPTPGVAHDNREALEFLRQALARLAAAGNSEAIAGEIRGVYLQANHLVMGPKVWEPGLFAEYDAWEQYVVSSGVPEYQVAKKTVHAAGTAVCEAAFQWWAEQGDGVPIAGNPDLADALVGIGDVLRQAITDAMTAVQTENAAALEQLRWSVEQLDAETDPELLIRNAGTVFAVAGHLLHGEAMDPVLAEEQQAWISTRPSDAVVTATRDHLVPAAKEFFEQALQRFQWYPFHALMVWDAPVNPLVSAGQHARAADRP
jgi:hypothetical protein